MTINKLVKPLLVSCFLPLAFSANAESSFLDKNNFVTIKAGIDQPSVGNNNANVGSAKTAFVGGIEVGRKFSNRYSLSLEYTYFGKSDLNISEDYNTQSKTSWSVRSDVLMANVAMDLLEESKITPFIQAGAGFSRNKAYNFTQSTATNSNQTGNTQTKFSWKVGAGVNFKTHEMFETEFTYNFVNRGKFETKNGSVADPTTPARNVKLQDHVFMIGLKVKF